MFLETHKLCMESCQRFSVLVYQVFELIGVVQCAQMLRDTIQNRATAVDQVLGALQDIGLCLVATFLVRRFVLDTL